MFQTFENMSFGYITKSRLFSMEEGFNDILDLFSNKLDIDVFVMVSLFWVFDL